MLKLLFVLIWLITESNSSAPIISIRDGKIKGEIYITSNTKSYYGFRGIPYARPPVGNLRFESPQMPEPWEGTLNAQNDSKSCITSFYIFNENKESEDCLYVNVYTPTIQENAKLPVMFWIYGGDFITGNSSKNYYGPDFLIEKDVVLVTFNYRLGPFGFIATGDAILPGNYGLKDQNLALQWVRENIAYFGGDPNKVTIFGQSAGSASVSFHLLSKKSSGLFRAAIMESGSALDMWAINRDPKSYALKLASDAGYDGSNVTTEVKEFLKRKSVSDIVEVTDWIKLNWPVKEVEHADAFIQDLNYELFKNGNFNRVPTIIGMCSQESLAFLLQPIVAMLEALIYDNTQELLLPIDFASKKNNTNEIIKEIKSIYLQENDTFSQNLTSYAQFITDTFFTRGILKQAELQSWFNPVYLYQFSYEGRTTLKGFIKGAGHSAELPFLFKMSNIAWNDTDTQNVLIQDQMVRMWTNFAKYLDPTPVKSELFSNITWTRFNPLFYNYLNIDSTLRMGFFLRQPAFGKWKRIFEEYALQPYNTF
ncbi:juvenile hormone esterase-like [Anthonomus grandis grandis]|uniref:juvenile hormone esterase-like n=1 Tax=Anthonomus grandis grandis TaxID=2921223 RepID=UPI0021667A47|nr:juvenile hormone esterase-like [Anthonomus grandis grandis]